MAKTIPFANNVLRAIFHNEEIPGLTLPAASAGNIYVQLHTANPVTDGVAEFGQATNECNYTGYNRVAVERSSVGWTIIDNVLTPTLDIEFPECTDAVGISQTATHMSFGTSATGVGFMMHHAELPTPILIEEGIVPRLRKSSSLTEY